MYMVSSLFPFKLNEAKPPDYLFKFIVIGPYSVPSYVAELMGRRSRNREIMSTLPLHQ
jgi:hypothetical protein